MPGESVHKTPPYRSITIDSPPWPLLENVSALLARHLFKSGWCRLSLLDDYEQFWAMPSASRTELVSVVLQRFSSAPPKNIVFKGSAIGVLARLAVEVSSGSQLEGIEDVVSKLVESISDQDLHIFLQPEYEGLSSYTMSNVSGNTSASSPQGVKPLPIPYYMKLLSKYVNIVEHFVRDTTKGSFIVLRCRNSSNAMRQTKIIVDRIYDSSSRLSEGASMEISDG